MIINISLNTYIGIIPHIFNPLLLINTPSVIFKNNCVRTFAAKTINNCLFLILNKNAIPSSIVKQMINLIITPIITLNK